MSRLLTVAFKIVLLNSSYVAEGAAEVFYQCNDDGSSDALLWGAAGHPMEIRSGKYGGGAE